MTMTLDLRLDRAGALLAAERIKLCTTRALGWCTVVAAVLALGVTALLATLDDVAPGPAVGLQMAVPVITVLGVLAVSDDHRFGTVRVGFTAVPNRRVGLAARAAVVAAAAGLVGLVIGFADLGLIAWLRPEVPALPADGAQWRALLGGVPVLALAAVLAVGVAVLVRSAVAALTLLLGWQLGVEGLVRLLPGIGDRLHRWLPFVHASHFQAGHERVPGRRLFVDQLPFGHWGSLAYFAGVCLAMLLVAVLVAERRDA